MFIMKILYTLPCLSFGGLEKDTLEIAKEVANKGHEVHMIAKSGPLKKQLPHNIIFFDINLKSKNPLKILINIIKVKKYIKLNKIGVVNSNSRIPAIISYVSTKSLKNVKHVYTVHGVHRVQNKLKFLYNSIPLKAANIIAVSKFVERHLRQVYKMPMNITVINRGINLNFFNQADVSMNRIKTTFSKLGLNDLTGKILFMPARYTPIKGQKNVLLAVDALVKAFGVTNFLVVFSGKVDKKAYYEELKSIIEEKKIGEFCRLFENVNDIQSVYKISHATLSTSIHPEAFGKTVIESFAMGRPVIASKLGAVVDNVTPKTSILVDPNDISELAVAIKTILEMESYDYNKMCHSCLEHVKKFSFEKTIDDTVALYNSI